MLADAALAWTTRYASERAIDAERRRRRRAIRLAAGVLVAMMILGAIAVFAVGQRERARAEARDAQARRLDASSAAVLGTDPELGLLLATESARLSPGPTTEDALRNALLASTVRAYLPLGEPVRDIAISGDGRHVAAVGSGGLLRIWDLPSHRLLAERGIGPDGDSPSLVAARSSRTGARGPPVEITPGGRVTCTFGYLPVTAAAVAGGLVVLGTGNVFEAGTCIRRATIEGVSPGVSMVVASADGTRVAFVVGRRADIAALPGNRVVARIRHPTRIVSLAMDESGKRIVTAAADSAVSKTLGRHERHARA